jgi:hypothetical protein
MKIKNKMSPSATWQTPTAKCPKWRRLALYSYSWPRTALQVDAKSASFVD